jgi:hypothetical protein
MAQVVRRLDGDQVEILFETARDPESASGKMLLDFAADREDMIPLYNVDDHVEGVQVNAKTWVQYLQSVNAPDAAVSGFRAALDDSPRAVRARQRVPRKKR